MLTTDNSSLQHTLHYLEPYCPETYLHSHTVYLGECHNMHLEAEHASTDTHRHKDRPATKAKRTIKHTLTFSLLFKPKPSSSGLSGVTPELLTALFLSRHHSRSCPQCSLLPLALSCLFLDTTVTKPDDALTTA